MIVIFFEPACCANTQDAHDKNSTPTWTCQILNNTRGTSGRVKITIQVQTVYCGFVLTLLMWFIWSDVSGPSPWKPMTPFGSHFRQTTWGRLSALTLCCTEFLVSKADVTEQLQQALSLCALPKTNNMAAKKNPILEKVHSSKSNHYIYFYFYFWANCLNKEMYKHLFLNRFDSTKKIQLY